jgi:hypothetical protein
MLLAATTAAVLALGASPAAADETSPHAEFELVSKINQERAERGLPRLITNLQMLRLARDWASTMAADSFLRHRPDLAEAVDGPFVRLAENVGVTTLTGADESTLVTRLHRAFMDSPGHRLHVLGDFNMVGVGVARGANGSMWTAVNFVKGPIDDFPLYRDLAGSDHERSVTRLFVRGLVGGCSSRRYCPAADVTRRELAIALDRATGVRTARYRMAATCGTSTDCAAEPVTRGEMARMLVEALDLEPVAGRAFRDVRVGDAGAVNAIVSAGIAVGCSATHFCPEDRVNRAQMATFIDRAMDAA